MSGVIGMIDLYINNAEHDTEMLDNFRNNYSNNIPYIYGNTQ